MRTAHSPHTVTFRRAKVMLLTGALSVWVLPALAQAPIERMSDKDVKALIEQVETSRDKFEGNLDGKFKDSTLRDATKEVKVSAALQDYKDNIKKLKERFTDDYSASAEVVTVLKQAENFEKFMKSNPTMTKGRSEWERHVTDLKHLGGAYFTTFPMPDAMPARRINDKETAGAADSIAQAADRVKDDLDKVSSDKISKPDKEGIKKNLELLGKQAELIKSRTADGKPATAEVRQLLTQMGQVQKFIDAHPTPSAAGNWQAVQASLMKLQQAFGMTR